MQTRLAASKKHVHYANSLLANSTHSTVTADPSMTLSLPAPLSGKRKAYDRFAVNRPEDYSLRTAYQLDDIETPRPSKRARTHQNAELSCSRSQSDSG